VPVVEPCSDQIPKHTPSNRAGPDRCLEADILPEDLGELGDLCRELPVVCPELGDRAGQYRQDCEDYGVGDVHVGLSVMVPSP